MQRPLGRFPGEGPREHGRLADARMTETAEVPDLVGRGVLDVEVPTTDRPGVPRGVEGDVRVDELAGTIVVVAERERGEAGVELPIVIDEEDDIFAVVRHAS